MTDKINALERLAKLRADGTLTEQEYEAQKAQLFAAQPKAPFYRSLAFVILSTWLMLPLAFIILISGPVYRRPRDRGYVPMSKKARWIYAALLIPLACLMIWLKTSLDSDNNSTVSSAHEHPAIQQSQNVNPANRAPSMSSPSSQEPANEAPDDAIAASSPQAASTQEQPEQGDENPVEYRFSEQYRQCMATGDAAAGQTDALVKCTNSELSVQSDKINATYQNVMASLTPDRRQELRTEERSWIKERDATCVPTYTSQGNLDRLAQSSCLLNATVERTIALEKLQASPSQPQQSGGD
jgi:uncharacterized protein YecT (DUF1311 family)